MVNVDCRERGVTENMKRSMEIDRGMDDTLIE